MKAEKGARKILAGTERDIGRCTEKEEKHWWFVQVQKMEGKHSKAYEYRWNKNVSRLVSPTKKIPCFHWSSEKCYEIVPFDSSVSSNIMWIIEPN